MNRSTVPDQTAFQLQGHWLRHLPGLRRLLGIAQPDTEVLLAGQSPTQICLSIDALLQAAKPDSPGLWVGLCSYEAAAHWNWPRRFPDPGPGGLLAAWFPLAHLQLQPLYPPACMEDRPRLSFSADWRADDYRQAFAAVQQYIHAGDCYQVNLSQRFRAMLEPTVNAADLCRHSLTDDFNEPWSGWFQHAERAVISYSPEQFLCIEDGWMSTRPIKGTRPRSADPEADQALAQALLDSLKDRAENLMIVDLLRNDLGAVALTGSVNVPDLFRLESHSNVHHLVSTVQARLDPACSPLQALLACLPGGSITGAPKVRAMEIIRSLERGERGYYCGSLFAFDGRDLASNLLIRSLDINRQEVSLRGGGGIVADSDCAAEYQESMIKIAHIRRLWEPPQGAAD